VSKDLPPQPLALEKSQVYSYLGRARFVFTTAPNDSTHTSRVLSNTKILINKVDAALLRRLAFDQNTILDGAVVKCLANLIPQLVNVEKVVIAKTYPNPTKQANEKAQLEAWIRLVPLAGGPFVSRSIEVSMPKAGSWLLVKKILEYTTVETLCLFGNGCKAPAIHNFIKFMRLNAPAPPKWILYDINLDVIKRHIDLPATKSLEVHHCRNWFNFLKENSHELTEVERLAIVNLVCNNFHEEDKQMSALPTVLENVIRCQALRLESTASWPDPYNLDDLWLNIGKRL
jgi:hypothetical protein